jgi:hypothetical protein
MGTIIDDAIVCARLLPTAVTRARVLAAPLRMLPHDFNRDASADA